MAVPTFSLRRLDEVLPDRFTAWVRWACLVTGFGYGALLFMDVRGLRAQEPMGLLGEAAALILALTALLITQRGRPALGVLILILGVAFEIHWAIFLDGDLARGGALVVPVLVLAGGALLGGRAPYVLAALAMVTLPLAVLLGGVRDGAPRAAFEAEFGNFVVMALALLATAVLLHQAIRSFENVLALAQTRAQRVSELIEYSPDAILVLDGDRQVRVANPAADRLFRRPRDWFVGRPARGLGLCPAPDTADRDVDADPMERVLEGSERPVLLGLAEPGDTGLPRRLLEATSRSVQGAGATRLQILLRDVTEREALLAERREMELRVQHAHRLQAVAVLAGGVAHDFNNLFTVVRGVGDLLRSEPDPKVKELATDLIRAQEHGANLTRKLLTFARRDDSDPTLVSLAAVVRDAEVFLRSLLGDAVVLELKLLDDATVVADPDKLDQALAHLVANARDAGATHVVVAVEGAPDDQVQLSVSDDGHGMDPWTRDRVFDPFFTTREQGRGVGLGLSTVLGVVDGIGGHIEVESAPGRGSRFTLRMPRVYPA